MLCHLGGTSWTAAIFPARPAFLYGAVRALGLEEGGVRVRIPELSSTSSQFIDQIITSPSLDCVLRHLPLEGLVSYSVVTYVLCKGHHTNAHESK